MKYNINISLWSDRVTLLHRTAIHVTQYSCLRSVSFWGHDTKAIINLFSIKVIDYIFYYLMTFFLRRLCEKAIFLA